MDKEQSRKAQSEAAEAVKLKKEADKLEKARLAAIKKAEKVAEQIEENKRAIARLQSEAAEEMDTRPDGDDGEDEIGEEIGEDAGEDADGDVGEDENNGDDDGDEFSDGAVVKPEPPSGSVRRSKRTIKSSYKTPQDIDDSDEYLSSKPKGRAPAKKKKSASPRKRTSPPKRSWIAIEPPCETCTFRVQTCYIDTNSPQKQTCQHCTRSKVACSFAKKPAAGPSTIDSKIFTQLGDRFSEEIRAAIREEIIQEMSDEISEFIADVVRTKIVEVMDPILEGITDAVVEIQDQGAELKKRNKAVQRVLKDVARTSERLEYRMNSLENFHTRGIHCLNVRNEETTAELQAACKVIRETQLKMIRSPAPPPQREALPESDDESTPAPHIPPDAPQVPTPVIELEVAVQPPRPTPAEVTTAGPAPANVAEGEEAEPPIAGSSPAHMEEVEHTQDVHMQDVHAGDPTPPSDIASGALQPTAHRPSSPLSPLPSDGPEDGPVPTPKDPTPGPPSEPIKVPVPKTPLPKKRKQVSTGERRTTRQRTR